MYVRHARFMVGAITLVLALAGCSTYSGVVNQLGPDTPVSDLRRDQGGELQLASSAPPFCPAPALKVLLFFHHDTTILTDASRQDAKRFYREVSDHQVNGVLITGHADTTGSDAYNMALSQRRADKVKADMIGIGINPTFIETRARGERELLVPTRDNVREPKNRRAEIEIKVR